MENRQQRLFLAILLSMGVWMAITFIFFPPKPPQKKPTKKVEQQAETPKDAPDSKPTETAEKDKKPVNLPPVKIVPPEEIETIHIKTDPYLVKLSSKGGRIEKYYIKNYKNMDGTEVLIAKDENMSVQWEKETYKAVEISRDLGFDFNPSEEIDYIPSSPFNHVNFAVEKDPANNRVKFSTVLPGTTIRLDKEYIFYQKENYFRFKISYTNIGTEPSQIVTSGKPLLFRGFGSLGPLKDGPLNDRDQMHYFRFYYLDGSFKDSVDGISNDGFFSKMFSSGNEDKRFERVSSGGKNFEFWGAGSRYFIAVLNPLDKKGPGELILDNRDKNISGILGVYENSKLAPNTSQEYEYAAYVGIRERDGMVFRDSNFDPKVKQEGNPFANLSENLNKSFNQGLTTPFRNGIVWLLKQLYHYAIPNYGWCIVVFAILFKMVFYPLNQKQAESMKKMQELNPLIQEINQKYEKDPAVKQQKVMELYKKHNANPMGGCLPMLIQIPIFIALYTAFSDTIDLWKSPFLWITDLSEPDTVWNSPAFLGGATGLSLNILPLIMVATQIIQTQMTSVSSDPNQKTMMYIMPVIMLYFFWSMPSGVTLYWTMQNVLSIAQQVYTNKYSKSKKELAPTVQTTVVQNPPPRRNRNNPRNKK